MPHSEIADPEKPITVEVIGVGRKEFPNAYQSDDVMTAAVVASSRANNSGVRRGARGFASFDTWDPDTRVLRLRFNSKYA